jgi:MFS family permease
MANEELGGGAATFGTMMAVLGAGSLVGALWVAHYGRASTRIMVGATFVLGVTMTAAALAPNLVTELAALAVVGLSAMVLIAMATAICNEVTAPELRGRVMAMFSIAFLGSTPIGAPLVGWISETLGPRAGLAIGAISAFAIASYAFFARRHDLAVVVALTSTDVELAESVADAA